MTEIEVLRAEVAALKAQVAGHEAVLQAVVKRLPGLALVAGGLGQSTVVETKPTVAPSKSDPIVELQRARLKQFSSPLAPRHGLRPK